MSPSSFYRELSCPYGGDETRVQTVTSLAFTEGPAVAADGSVYFSDILNNRILHRNPDGALTVFRQPSHRTNGQTFDLEGRLLHCEGAEFGPGGGRRVTRTALETGDYEILTDRFGDARYNSPNDICVDGVGRIYFTDPCYDDRSQMEMFDEFGSPIEGVYRIDTNGTVHRIMQQPAIERPNGIAVTQDGKRLYVIDSCPVPGGNRKVWSFDLDEQGKPSNQRVVHDFAPGRGGDGMRLDIDENLYVAAGIVSRRGEHETEDVPPGIYVMTPEGKLLGRIPVHEDVLTNLAFGGPDGRTIFVTAGKSLFSARVPTPGQVAYPRWRES